MSAESAKPAHAVVATDVSTTAGWPSGACGPLGTPAQAASGAPDFRRRTVLKLRVNAEERARIAARVPAGREFSEWARTLLATGSGEDVGAARRERTRQVAALGNNLNQIAPPGKRGQAVNSQ